MISQPYLWAIGEAAGAITLNEEGWSGLLLGARLEALDPLLETIGTGFEPRDSPIERGVRKPDRRDDLAVSRVILTAELPEFPLEATMALGDQAHVIAKALRDDTEMPLRVLELLVEGRAKAPRATSKRSFRNATSLFVHLQR